MAEYEYEYESIRKELEVRREELIGRLSRIKNEASFPLNQSSKERALELKENEVATELEREGLRELSQIDRCLEKMKQGEYGVCQDCGDLIPTKRLKAIPFAEYCINCCEERESRSA
jgi:RNA polymerase-binding protein DksA